MLYNLVLLQDIFAVVGEACPAFALLFAGSCRLKFHSPTYECSARTEYNVPISFIFQIATMYPKWEFLRMISVQHLTVLTIL